MTHDNKIIHFMILISNYNSILFLFLITQQMQSKIYPSLIRYQQNQYEMFVSDCQQQINSTSNKPLNPNHSSIPKYAKAVSKLFSQINFSQQNLWIFPLNGTKTVKVYFSDPQFYPISLCCEKCVYLQIQEDLSGSIICPSCQIILVSFIHYDQNPFKDGKITQIQKQRLFKEKKKQNLTKNKVMYENLTSHRYKNKDLKKVLSNYANQPSTSYLLTSSKQSSSKDGFILQMKTELLRFNQNNQVYKSVQKAIEVNKGPDQNQTEQTKNKKSYLNMKSIQQTKNIIFDIFK